MTKFAHSTLFLALVVASAVASATPVSHEDSARDYRRALRLDDESLDNNEAASRGRAKLFPYGPHRARAVGQDSDVHDNNIRSLEHSDWIPEASLDAGGEVMAATDDAKKVLSPKQEGERESISPRPLTAKELEQAKSIAFNSREVRLIGPQQKAVEMKDDMATKMLIAFENLQKDATGLWGQVSEKVDKGWTELKTMIEETVSKKQSPPASSSRSLRETPQSSVVVVSPVDGYSMAEDDSSISKQAENAVAKIKGFFSS